MEKTPCETLSPGLEETTVHEVWSHKLTSRNASGRLPSNDHWHGVKKQLMQDAPQNPVIALAVALNDNYAE